ncbi:MAG: SHOCT domain-containing protein [Solirubrobacteraceae bacterium]
MAGKERPAAVFAPSIRSIKVYESGRIEYQKKSGSIIGATARVDSSGTQRGLRDTRRVVLTIEGPRVAISAALPAGARRVHEDARKFAATVNEMAMRLAGLTPAAEPAAVGDPDPAQIDPSPPISPQTAELLDYLERLGKLRNSGVLTEDEFQAQKARLLRAAGEP